MQMNARFQKNIFMDFHSEVNIHILGPAVMTSPCTGAQSAAWAAIPEIRIIMTPDTGMPDRRRVSEVNGCFVCLSVISSLIAVFSGWPVDCWTAADMPF